MADPIISFFFEPFPATLTYTQLMAHKLEQPGKLAKYMLYDKKDNRLGAGIFSTYAGFYEASNQIGQTIYPRKHAEPLLYVLITPRITPIMMFQNTVHHWELEPSMPAQMFKMERQKDTLTETSFWDVNKVALPKDNVIPLQSIVIFAKPKNIFVPTGITLTQESANLLLPIMYAKKGISKNKHALFVLDISHLFGPVNSLYKKGPTEYQQHITA